MNRHPLPNGGAYVYQRDTLPLPSSDTGVPRAKCIPQLIIKFIHTQCRTLLEDSTFVVCTRRDEKTTQPCASTIERGGQHVLAGCLRGAELQALIGGMYLQPQTQGTQEEPGWKHVRGSF